MRARDQCSTSMIPPLLCVLVVHQLTQTKSGKCISITAKCSLNWYLRRIQGEGLSSFYTCIWWTQAKTCLSSCKSVSWFSVGSSTRHGRPQSWPLLWNPSAHYVGRLPVIPKTQGISECSFMQSMLLNGQDGQPGRGAFFTTQFHCMLEVPW